MYKQNVDVANRSTQIIINEACAGLSLYPLEDQSPISWADFIGIATVRVELVRKSQPNAVLYTMPLKSLYEIWKGFFKIPKGVVIPFAFKDNLLLTKDSYLQVDITWQDFPYGEILKSFEVQKNTLATSTNVPISFKKIALDGEKEVNTEHFEYVFIPNTVKKIETFIDSYKTELVGSSKVSTVGGPSLSSKNKAFANDMALPVSGGVNYPKIDTGDCCCSHEVTRQKIEMDFNYMSFISAMPTDTNVLFKTQANQEVKFFGTGEIILMQS